MWWLLHIRNFTDLDTATFALFRTFADFDLEIYLSWLILVISDAASRLEKVPMSSFLVKPIFIALYLFFGVHIIMSFESFDILLQYTFRIHKVHLQCRRGFLSKIIILTTAVRNIFFIDADLANV